MVDEKVDLLVELKDAVLERMWAVCWASSAVAMTVFLRDA